MILLAILDGWGYSNSKIGNAIYYAHTPNFDEYMARYPHTLLEASGEAVGLPAGQMGNSEVGHLNIGAGRIVYQESMKILKAIEEDREFRYTLMGLLGFREILDRITKLEERQQSLTLQKLMQVFDNIMISHFL